MCRLAESALHIFSCHRFTIPYRNHLPQTLAALLGSLLLAALYFYPSSRDRVDGETLPILLHIELQWRHSRPWTNQRPDCDVTPALGQNVAPQPSRHVSKASVTVPVTSRGNRQRILFNRNMEHMRRWVLKRYLPNAEWSAVFLLTMLVFSGADNLFAY